jgi:hypothetical protein
LLGFINFFRSSFQEENLKNRQALLTQLDNTFTCDCLACNKNYQNFSSNMALKNVPKNYLELARLVKENWQRMNNLYDGRETNETSRKMAWQIQSQNSFLMSAAAYLITWPCEHLYDPSMMN